MTTTTSKLPFFVYGTLMQGCGNGYYLTPHTDDVQPATLPGYVLKVAGALPYVTVASAGYKAAGVAYVHGELVTVKPDRFGQVLRTLDRLESFYPDSPQASLYVRTECAVALEDGTTVQAWAYLGGMIDASRNAELVASGSWREFRAVLEARRQAEWHARELALEVTRRADAIEALTWLLAQPEGFAAAMEGAAT